MTTYSFIDESGETRLVGTISPAPGGGSQAVQGIYQGSPVEIANNASVNLTFDGLASGTALLDLTDPANPLFLATGTYAITLNWELTGTFTAGGWALGQLYVAENSLVGNSQISGPQSSGNPESVTAIVVVTDVTQPLFFNVSNIDGVSSQNFALARTNLVKL